MRAQDDEHGEAADWELLDRATELGRVIVTFDQDFLAEARRRQETGINFAGIIFGREDKVSIGQLVEDLTLIAHCMEPHVLENRVLYLPL